VAYDTLWVPKSARGKYVSLCERTLSLLGGRASLSDDDGHFFSFKEQALTPLKGLGLLGIAYFVPGVIWTLVRLLSGKSWLAKPLPSPTFNSIMLVSLAIGAFVMCHVVLRWQAIGLVRLMFPFVIAGAPLGAFLLHKQWLKIPAALLLLLSCGMFLIFWTGHVSRRMGWSERPEFRFISRLQNSHTATVKYQWKGQPAGEFEQREDYSRREIYDKLFEGLRQPCSIGFIGTYNDQCLELFGTGSQNRVIPLVDCRAEEKILEPPADLDYLIAANKFEEVGDWAKLRGFEQIFSCSDARGELVRAFAKLPLSTTQRQQSRSAALQPP
jgi:hypothetical protein